MTTSTHSISVIIPVYRVEDYIEDCLRSVLQQEVDYEIILIDDCGDDESISLAKNYLENQELLPGDRWQIIHHEKNVGLSAARNTGIKAAKGRYLYFLDSDDALMSHALKRLLDKADETKAVLTIGSIKLQVGDRWEHKLDENLTYDGDIVLESYIRRDWYEMAWNKLILRNFILDNNLFFVDGLIHEDEVWSLQLACLKPRVAAISTDTYYYRNDRVGSIMHDCNQINMIGGAQNKIVTLWHCLQVAKKHGLLANYIFLQNCVQAWQLNYLFITPALCSLTLLEKWKYYAFYAQYSDICQIKSHGLSIDWRFRAIALICTLPNYVASILLMVFLQFWKQWPGERVGSIIKNTSSIHL